jgi:hypothetical protein
VLGHEGKNSEPRGSWMTLIEDRVICVSPCGGTECSEFDRQPLRLEIKGFWDQNSFGVHGFT